MTITPAILVGGAIGDALGMPYETLDETVHPGLAAWDGSFQPGTFHKLPAGHYTDDTEMMECLATSIVTHGVYHPDDAAARYLLWAQGTPHGMGGTTKQACAALARGIDWRWSGVTFDDPNAVGSAPPMRAAPLGVLDRFLPKDSSLSRIDARYRFIMEACNQDARITHNSVEGVAASAAVAYAVSSALLGWAPDQILNVVIRQLERLSSTKVQLDVNYVRKIREMQLSFNEQLRVRGVTIPDDPCTRISWTLNQYAFSRRGNARSITATALFCALTANNFRDGVVAAVKFGGDADTRGAIAGAILGARFGLEGIPDEYKAGVKDFERFAALDRQLVAGRA